jgi:hypothetical protein
MPFDSTPIFDPLTFSPGREGLRKLSYLLRAEMPAKFRWDYSIPEMRWACGTSGCAFGLCRVVWPHAFRPESEDNGYMIEQMATVFHLPYQDARTLFHSSYGRTAIAWDDVQPSEVADAIDRYLAKTAS